MRNQLGQEARGNEILVRDIPFPISMAGDFLQFLSNNLQLPNGRTNPIPALTPEEFRLFHQPYKEWAPAPFNNNSNVHDAAIVLFMLPFSHMLGMSELDAIFSSGGFEGPSFLDHELHFNKMRAWGGLVPISDRRWRAKGLNQYNTNTPPVSFLKAIGHLEKTGAFMYFNIPAGLDKVRKAYNRAYDHLDHFDRALSAHYARQPSHLQPKGLAGRGKAADLWAEFFFSHVQFMTARSHTWYTNHANNLHDNIVDEFKKAPLVNAVLSPEQETTMQKLEMIVAYRVKADLSILISLADFKNDLPHWQHLSSPPTVDWDTYHATSGTLPIPGTLPQDILQRERAYIAREKYLVNQMLAATGAATALGNPIPWNPEPALRLAWQARHQTRDEVRGGPPTPIVEELWISRLRARLDLTPSPSSKNVKYTSWGFVAYRLNYSHTPLQWSIFQALFNSEVITNWGEGVHGHEHVKPKCKITWLDGRDYNIPENDIVAARTHFQSLRDTKSPLIEGLLTPHDAFLVADGKSINAFLLPNIPPTKLVDAADIPPFIVIAQSQPFDAAKAAQDNESPGYAGHFYVAGSVLFDDIWAALFMRLYGLKAMWPIAAAHPAALYLGPYADYQVGDWNEWYRGQMEIMNQAKSAKEGGGK